MVIKRSHMVKQTCYFQLQICLSICDLYVTTRIKGLKNIFSWPINIDRNNVLKHKNLLFYWYRVNLNNYKKPMNDCVLNPKLQTILFLKSITNFKPMFPFSSEIGFIITHENIFENILRFK